MIYKAELRQSCFGENNEMPSVWLCHGKEWQEKFKKQGYCAKFLCRVCGKQSVDTDWKRMRFPREQVETAVDIRHRGLTLEDTRRAVSKAFRIPVRAFSTIYRWSKKFAKQTSCVIEGLSDLLHVDETMIKSFCRGEFFYLWASKCSGTKKVVSWHVSEFRTTDEAEQFFWSTRRRFSVFYWPKAIRTDGWPGYRYAIHKVLGHETYHDKFISFKSHSNNVIENFFRCKRRFPRFRTLESARTYIAHWISTYNEEKDIFQAFLVIRLWKIIHVLNEVRFIVIS